MQVLRETSKEGVCFAGYLLQQLSKYWSAKKKINLNKKNLIKSCRINNFPIYYNTLF